jgi:hypothetical protein
LTLFVRDVGIQDIDDPFDVGEQAASLQFLQVTGASFRTEFVSHIGNPLDQSGTPDVSAERQSGDSKYLAKPQSLLTRLRKVTAFASHVLQMTVDAVDAFLERFLLLALLASCRQKGSQTTEQQSCAAHN